MTPILINLAYLVSAIFFIFGLKLMTHPRTAVRGNLFGAIGMAIAVGAALVGLEQYVLIAVGIGIGAIIGVVLAWRIEMTSMPQLVALFNGLGGAASVFVAGSFLIQKLMAGGESPASDELAATALSGLIGAITFWGSLIAFGKLQELAMFRKPFAIPAQQVINAILALLLLMLTVVTAFCTGDSLWM
ncbi:MAG: NAD(P)(+) transhydrogenase (Re/Si-specific) subunit beta, partial [bacterium]|nr:NAD(P)(+) transhydrogenase (Re/Si-specific) subunit beta [bacterium]